LIPINFNDQYEQFGPYLLLLVLLVSHDGFLGHT